MGLFNRSNKSRVDAMLSDPEVAREVMKSLMLSEHEKLNRVIVEEKKKSVTDLTVDGKKLTVTELG